MAGVGVIFMKGEELDFFRVLVHESGHIWDLFREVTSGDKSDFYDGSYRLYLEDPSVTYYGYSWSSNYDRIDDSQAFASTYAMSDPFEDFAESFALYVLQGDTFANWQRTNRVLAQKYNYINDAFQGKTFPSAKRYYVRPYDVTMLVVDYEELL